jgi:hypothetical protein
MIFKTKIKLEHLVFPAIIIGFVIASFLALKFVMHQFGGYDLSPLIDLTWRFQSEQIPGRDFPNTWPLLILAITKILSFADGFNWIYLTIANIFLSFVVFSYSSFLIFRYDTKYKNLLIFFIFTAVSVPILYSNHIWHSSMSQLVGILFLLSVYFFLKFPKRVSNFSYIAVFLSSALLSGTKQNLGPPFLLAIIFFLLIYKVFRRFRLIMVIIAGYITGLLVFFIFIELSAKDFLYIYTGPSSRLIPKKELIILASGIKSNFVVFALFLILVILLANSLLKVQGTDLPTKFLLLALLISALPVITDWDSKLNNTSLPFVILLILITNYDQLRNSAKHPPLKILVLCGISLVLLFTSAFGGYSRERMSHVGPFFEKPASYEIHTKLFKGLHTGKTLMLIEKEMARIKRNEEGNIFMGPRIEFGYFETDNISPKGLPPYWFPGTSFALRDESKIANSFIGNDFSLCVLAPNGTREGDRQGMPENIQEYIDENFYRDWTYTTLVVLRRQ